MRLKDRSLKAALSALKTVEIEKRVFQDNVTAMAEAEVDLVVAEAEMAVETVAVQDREMVALKEEANTAAMATEALHQEKALKEIMVVQEMAARERVASEGTKTRKPVVISLRKETLSA